MEQGQEIFGDPPWGVAFIQQFMRDHRHSTRDVMQQDFQVRLAREEERRGGQGRSRGPRYEGHSYGRDRYSRECPF